MPLLLSVLEHANIQCDDAQRDAVHALQRFHDDWITYKQNQQGFKAFLNWIRPATLPHGIYLWGGVGRGKSLLMDTLFHAIDEPKKSRLHFHAFMRRIHKLLAIHKDKNDPLIYVAKLMAKETRLLCFDEFHVSDIADAMILGRLLEWLFKEGVGLILTSNYPPDALYPNGLQRQSFLPSIGLLKQNLHVVELKEGTDYRLRTLSSAQLYHAPSTPETHSILSQQFTTLNIGHPITREAIIINDRSIDVQGRSEHTIWFDFHALCGTTRSQHDYLALADLFDTFILSDVPILGGDTTPEAIRFKWLIDILYDHRIKLMLSADVELEALVPAEPHQKTSQSGQGGQRGGEFSRTLSRLTEMQSLDYLHQAKRPVLEEE